MSATNEDRLAAAAEKMEAAAATLGAVVERLLGAAKDESTQPAAGVPVFLSGEPGPAASVDENLTDSNTAFLFGRPFVGLTIDESHLGAATRRINAEEQGAGKAMLARIYGFSWSGCYYKLPAPCVFLVYGEGRKLNHDYVGRENATASGVLLDFRSQQFAPDIVAWRLLDLDYTVRIEINAGFLADILIAPDATEANNMTGPDESAEAAGGMTGRAAMAGRAAMTGRAAMAARAAMVSRPPNS